MKYGDNAHRTTRALIRKHEKLCTLIEEVLQNADQPHELLHELLDIERELSLREDE